MVSETTAYLLGMAWSLGLGSLLLGMDKELKMFAPFTAGLSAGLLILALDH